MDKGDLEFAAEVDRLGTEGLSQEQIAERFGVTKWVLRGRLIRSGYELSIENRVRLSLTKERLEDALRRGAFPDEPAEEVAA